MFADGEITEFINRIKNVCFGMTLDEQLHLLEQFDCSQKEIERLQSVEKAQGERIVALIEAGNKLNCVSEANWKADQEWIELVRGETKNE